MEGHILLSPKASPRPISWCILEEYPKKLLDQLKNKEVVMAGNGHHDSIRQSTKYGTYTISCCTIGLLLHILLVRVFQFSTNALGKHHTPITGVFNSPHGK